MVAPRRIKSDLRSQVMLVHGTIATKMAHIRRAKKTRNSRLNLSNSIPPARNKPSQNINCNLIKHVLLMYLLPSIDPSIKPRQRYKCSSPPFSIFASVGGIGVAGPGSAKDSP